MKSLDRFELVMDRLAGALTILGAHLIKGDTAAVIVCGDERIDFSVTEALRREKHIPTAEEETQDEARRRRSAELRNPWDDELDRATSFVGRPEWDYHPTSPLSSALDAAYLDGRPRCMFGGAKIQQLEMLAPDIAVGVAMVAAAMKLDRPRRDDEARRCEEGTTWARAGAARPPRRETARRRAERCPEGTRRSGPGRAPRRVPALAVTGRERKDRCVYPHSGAAVDRAGSGALARGLVAPVLRAAAVWAP